MLSAYFAVAGVFGGWALGYMAADGDTRTGWRVWLSDIAVALSFAGFWPLVLIAAPTLIWLARRRHNA
jgi:hypothetical protein